MDEEHFTVGNKRKVKSAILDACVALGFKVTNEEDIRSRRDYNIYEIEYPRHYFSAGIKPTINAETVYIQKSYPHEVKPATSLVYDYVSEQGNEQFVLTYTELKPFDIAVQTIERTLVDKVFAVCDYKIDGRIYSNSRHIYDLRRLLDRIVLGDSLKALVKEVRADRKKHERCYSAQDGVDVPKLLSEIVQSEIYRQDYEDITMKMMYKSLSYDTAITALQQIIESGIFADDE